MTLPSIIVAGGVNLDTTFEVRALPTEGQSVSAASTYSSIGGKGLNQALAARRAGVPVAIVGATGDDAGSQRIRAFLESENIDTKFLLRVEGARTGQAIIVLDANARNLIIGESGANLLPEPTLIREMANAWGRWSAVDFVAANGETPNALVQTLFDAARDAGVPTAWNPSPMPEDPTPLLRRTDILVLNRTEAIELAGADHEPETLATRLRALGPRQVVLTLGEMGCVVADEDIIRVPARAVHVIDPTAAGDTFLGYFLASRSRGASSREAAQIASVAASICVQAKGAAKTIPKLESVVEALDDGGVNR